MLCYEHVLFKGKWRFPNEAKFETVHLYFEVELFKIFEDMIKLDNQLTNLSACLGFANLHSLRDPHTDTQHPKDSQYDEIDFL